jgi:hypothetical protein
LKVSRSISIVVLLFVLSLPPSFLVRTSAVRAAEGTVVKVLPNLVTADVGQSFVINVTVVDVQNLYGLDVTVNWNSTVLQLTTVDVRLGYIDTDGVLYNSSATSSPYIAINSTQDGQYEIAGTSEAPAPSFNGTGNIVQLTLKVIDSGNSTFGLGSELYDYPPPDRMPRISLPIEHSQVDGQFTTTIGEIPDSAVLLIFVLLTVAVVAVSRKMKRKIANPSAFDGANKIY